MSKEELKWEFYGKDYIIIGASIFTLEELQNRIENNFKRYKDEIEDLQKIIEDFKENSILKLKIKNKIEELKNKKEKTRTEKGALWGNVIYITDIKMKALEELLEEKK